MGSWSASTSRDRRSLITRVVLLIVVRLWQSLHNPWSDLMAIFWSQALQALNPINNTVPQKAVQSTGKVGIPCRGSERTRWTSPTTHSREPAMLRLVTFRKTRRQKLGGRLAMELSAGTDAREMHETPGLVVPGTGMLASGVLGVLGLPCNTP